MVIAVVRTFDLLDCFAAVDGSQEMNLGEVNNVRIARINSKCCVIPGPLAQVVSSIDALPFAAAVVGAEQAPLLRFDQGVNPPTVGGGNRYADFAPNAFRQTVRFFIGFTG